MGLKKRFSDSKNDSVIQISRQKTAQGFKKRFSESGGQRRESTAQKPLASERKTARIAAHGFNIRFSVSWVQIHLEQAEMPAPRRSLHSSRG